MHTIKPLDTLLLKKVFKEFKYIIVLEEHSSIGGLSSAISESYLNNQSNTNFLSLNTGKDFIVKSGKQQSAFKKLKISPEGIEKQIMNFRKRLLI